MNEDNITLFAERQQPTTTPQHRVYRLSTKRQVKKLITDGKNYVESFAIVLFGE